MVYLRIVRVTVYHPFMTMRMAMGFAQRRPLIMLVLMVFVVSVSMVVLERFMPMLVLVSLSQVQPDASSHQDGGTQKLKCQTIPQDQYGDQSSDKRRQ